MAKLTITGNEGSGDFTINCDSAKVQAIYKRPSDSQTVVLMENATHNVNEDAEDVAAIVWPTGGITLTGADDESEYTVYTATDKIYSICLNSNSEFTQVFLESGILYVSESVEDVSDLVWPS